MRVVHILSKSVSSFTECLVCCVRARFINRVHYCTGLRGKYIPVLNLEAFSVWYVLIVWLLVVFCCCGGGGRGGGCLEGSAFCCPLQLQYISNLGLHFV